MTDVFFCLFFLVFFLGMFVTTGYGFIMGNPYNVMIGWDSDGNGCGFNQTSKNYPMLYFP